MLEHVQVAVHDAAGAAASLLRDEEGAEGSLQLATSWNAAILVLMVATSSVWGDDHIAVVFEEVKRLVLAMLAPHRGMSQC